MATSITRFNFSESCEFDLFSTKKVAPLLNTVVIGSGEVLLTFPNNSFIDDEFKKFFSNLSDVSLINLKCLYFSKISSSLFLLQISCFKK